MSSEANNKNKEIELPPSGTDEHQIDFSANQGTNTKTSTTTTPITEKNEQTLEKITPRKKPEEKKEETEEIEFVARTLVLDASSLLKQLKSAGPAEEEKPEQQEKPAQVKQQERPSSTITEPEKRNPVIAKVTPINAMTPVPDQSSKKETTNPHFFTDPKMKYSSQLDRNPLSQIQQIEVNAKIRIAMAEAKTFVVAEAAAKAALLEFQVNQVLSKIYQKYPDTKNEIIKIQKLLNTHSKIKETDGTKEN